MNWFIDNWFIVVGALAVVVVAGIFIYRYFNIPSDEQLAKVKEWLLYAVVEAEKELGSGTGQIKLRQVYDMFIVRFPSLARMISFAQFSLLVDSALVEMKEMLSQNNAVKVYIEG